MIEEYLPAEIAGVPTVFIVIFLGCFAFFWFVLYPIWMITDCVKRKGKSRWFKALWIAFIIPTWCLGAWVYGISASNRWFIRFVSWFGQLGVVALIIFLVWVGFQNRDKLPQFLEGVNESGFLGNVLDNASEEEIEMARNLVLNAMKEQNQTSRSLKHLEKSGALNEILPKEARSKPAVTQKLPFDDGLENGLVRRYYDNGNIRSEATYVNGLANGIYKAYYIDGTLGAQGFKFNGQWDGVLTLYNEDGSVQDRIKYKRGIRVD